jgi:hypothetical protein
VSTDKNNCTFRAPKISKIEISMVMHKLIASIIFTTDCGSQSITIVLNSTRAVHIRTNEAIASSIPATPDITVPVRSE